METKEQNQTKLWIEQELKQTQQNTPTTFDKLPPLKLEEGKITEIVIDVSKPFEKYNTDNNGKPVTKAIIPVTHNGEKKTFWLNQKNPIYPQILARLKEGKTNFKIVQTGTQASTKYLLVD
jgi:hypothetical protein